ncbi:hypothetical protein [Cedecea sp. NFIX57]|uniref:hypothetical protein n=1 Tax=Cedecea sp. NFIX57 TaxID=1566286 RepID=UPI000A0EB581|nr:hypothetical protein [Cedecea sp. NFIX57]SMG55553.1 hypothetical protein SAMN03159353_101878 [Cedecea sp. NFIX57]
MGILKILRNIKKLYTPFYFYTLDHSVGRTSEGLWLFKEFGTHTFVKKSWNQLVDGDFLRQVNPKDIALIAETECKLKLDSSKLVISEEKRNCLWTIENEHISISISGNEFIRNKELIDKTETLDATRIAYYTGIKKGREISTSLTNRSAKVDKKKTFTLIK